MLVPAWGRFFPLSCGDVSPFRDISHSCAYSIQEVAIATDFSSAVAEYSEAVFCFLIDQCGERDLSEDLAQDTLLLALKNRDSYDESKSLKTWLFSIAANLLKSHYRKNSPLSIEGLEDLGYVLVDQAPSPEDCVVAREQYDQLCEAMEQLSDEDRLVLMCIAYDVPRREVARQLGVSVRAVDTRIWRAKKCLKDLLEGGE